MKIKTNMQKVFAKEYLVDLNATQAAIRAGYSPKTAKQQGQRLLTLPHVQEAVQKEMRKQSQRTEITADKVLQQWWDIATADPNDIICLRRVCCRHCYGKNFEYQWRDKKEYDKAVVAAEAYAKENEKTPIIPSNAGGYGFNRLLRPNPDCPYCAGEGQPELHAKDTRDLEPKARLLFAGIKQTQAGIEIKFRDQDKALENVARHLGMFIDKKEFTGPNGGPIQTAVDLSGLSLEELRNLAKLGCSDKEGDS
jgi:phage terminase small subunit